MLSVMAASRDELVRQIRQCQLDRLSSNDPEIRETLRKLILQLQFELAQSPE